MRASHSTEPGKSGAAVLELWECERTLAGTAQLYAGVDEAGRGCLAGPVVAAAVILGGTPEQWHGVDDSKKLSKPRRESLYEFIRSNAVAVGVGMASVDEIDTYNILHASRMAMGRAIADMDHNVQLALVDGPYGPLFSSTEIPSIPVIDGDAKCLSIAAASIVAKVVRDRWMASQDSVYPEYGFSRHVGYGTPEHLEALDAHGPIPLHRKSFGPVRQRMQTRLNLL